MKRAGFTMIELVFVIVILGILAAVAVPKLAATRDDAKLATARTNLGTCIADLGAAYTAQGVLPAVSSDPACAKANAFKGLTVAIDTNKTGLKVTLPTKGFSDFNTSYVFGGTGVTY